MAEPNPDTDKNIEMWKIKRVRSQQHVYRLLLGRCGPPAGVLAPARAAALLLAERSYWRLRLAAAGQARPADKNVALCSK